MFFNVAVGVDELNGHVGMRRLTHSLPGSPVERKSTFAVIGSAENLVSRILKQEGLGKYCDEDFVRNTSKEIQEALDMTEEEMDRAAHHILQEKGLHSSYSDPSQQ